MKTLVIDNFDSFTHNLCQYVDELGGRPVVLKNNEITPESVKSLAPSRIIISPGPGTVLNREDFGSCEEIILSFGPKTPILGVCLGHQGIAHAFGGKIVRSPQIVHGRQSLVRHDGSMLFSDIPNPFTAMRYHSLCVSPESFPRELTVTARDEEKNIIMGLRHGIWPVFGIQFHPESFGTPEGKKIIRNFLTLPNA